MRAMGYAQRIRSPKGDYYLGRYTEADGRRGVAVADPRTGKPVRHKSAAAARKAANAAEATRETRAAEAAAEAEEQAAREAAQAAAPILFAAWAERWYAAQRLKPSTMDNYRNALGLLAGRFGERPMTDAEWPPMDIDAWEADMLAAGYMPDTVRTYRGVLHTCLSDAVKAKLLTSNPATKPANRGQRGVSRARSASKPEKVITTVLGGLLVAERMAVLSGRDDEFMMTIAMQHAGLRLGEMIGLERCYVHTGRIRVEWQLSEVNGKLIRDIPKDGSRDDVVTAPYLDQILAEFQRLSIPAPCPCHGFIYVFRGLGAPRGVPRGAVTIADVAAAAGVSAGTVSNVFVHDERVSKETRVAVEEAVARLGWTPGSAPANPAWHWRRSRFDELFAMAASGRYPNQVRRGGLAGRPVPLAGDWPGTRVRGSRPLERAELTWLPVAQGLTPHGLRHSYRTWMEDNRVHNVLAEKQMRHELGGINVYRHVTDGMRDELRALAAEAWREALGRRLEMSPRSPVRVLDGLLRRHSDGVRTRTAQGRPGIVAGA